MFHMLRESEPAVDNFDRGYVYLVITGENFTTHRSQVPAAHPIHLHGHDFVVLDQRNSTYNESTAPLGFNYDNPPRRDVALLPAEGYLALAFKPDNPGIWLVHCHIVSKPMILSASRL